MITIRIFIHILIWFLVRQFIIVTNWIVMNKTRDIMFNWDLFLNSTNLWLWINGNIRKYIVLIWRYLVFVNAILYQRFNEMHVFFFGLMYKLSSCSRQQEEFGSACGWVCQNATFGLLTISKKNPGTGQQFPDLDGLRANWKQTNSCTGITITKKISDRATQLSCQVIFPSEYFQNVAKPWHNNFLFKKILLNARFQVDVHWEKRIKIKILG